MPRKGSGKRKGLTSLSQKTIDKYWASVIKKSIRECWGWSAGLGENGCGAIWIPEWKRSTSAHVVSYLIHFKIIPQGLEVCHDCDNPVCSNPFHLFLGTHFENMQDMMAKGRNKVSPRETNGRNKLRTEQVLGIRYVRKHNIFTRREVAGIVKVDDSTIRDIETRRIWKSV